MLTIGLVGAQDSIEAIYALREAYGHQATFVCHPYIHKEDTVEIVKRMAHAVDAILFSGRVPYNIATTQLKIDKPCVYVPHNGSCIYRTLWAIKEKGLPLDTVGFDTIDENEIREIYEELGIDHAKVKVFEYPGNIQYEKLADYHLSNWHEDKRYVAVTCLYKTAEILREKGVPVFRVNLTKALIRQMIETVIYEAESKRLKANQIAAVIIDIDNFKKHIQGYSSEYDVQKLKLKFNEKLIDYAKAIQGAVINIGSDEFMVFSTGGALEGDENESLRRSFKNEVRKDLGILFSMGIGYGRTAYEAEANGRIGVRHAKEAGGDCVFLVNHMREIQGPLDHDQMLSYALGVTDNGEAMAIAERTGLSSKNVTKIMSVIQKTGPQLTAKDLAFYMNMTERSARRLLATLLKSGDAEVKGEVIDAAKGRPRNVYLLKF